MKLNMLSLLVTAVLPAHAAAISPDQAVTEPGSLIVLLAIVVLICLATGGGKDGPFRPE
ncbi:hypothetical protein [Pseudoduganella chitinolytica]|uniref:PEP-CTERM sorting domain-containing protein n=1 Tax=Pseudoduganella chitinolytica TaxID=34070 RepID=A0ABY8BIK2_9BURK|nr:hypothetical protein [Pseudoduganella chitinolytica]WEF35806.1 hypothetical protein PX653_13980 [Pseudoduganella chitinolytica]